MLVRHAAEEFRDDYHVSTNRKEVVEVRQAALASGKLSPRQQPLIQRRMRENRVEYALTVLVAEPDYCVLAGEPTLH